MCFEEGKTNMFLNTGCQIVDTQELLVASSTQKSLFPPVLFSRHRLVLSRFEVESGEGPVESEVDEEEVWLFWKNSNKEVKSKSIRELAQDAKEGQKDDQDVISYYRSAKFTVYRNNLSEYNLTHKMLSGFILFLVVFI